MKKTWLLEFIFCLMERITACLQAAGNDLVNKKVWNPDGSLVMAQYLGRENVLMQEKEN